jgi:predicted transcriptional regulator
MYRIMETTMTTDPTEALLSFFKALADANRLRIVGLLAQGERGVEELAAALDLRPSTVSHHLARLAEAGLVVSRAEGHFHLYSLDLAALEGNAKRLLARDELRTLAGPSTDGDAWERKVLSTFTDAEGRITQFPMQRKKFEVLLRYVARDLEPGVDYSERELNTLLLRYSADTATLRRGLVDHRILDREPGGARYWRVGADHA